jgi:hypothetical protein
MRFYRRAVTYGIIAALQSEALISLGRRQVEPDFLFPFSNQLNIPEVDRIMIESELITPEQYRQLAKLLTQLIKSGDGHLEIRIEKPIFRTLNSIFL